MASNLPRVYLLDVSVVISFPRLNIVYYRRIPIPSLSIGHIAVQYRDLSKVVVVAVGCQERPGEFNPPIRPYEIIQIRCDPITNDVDARETGVMLRFFRDYYDKFLGKKLIFTHAHDTSFTHIRYHTIWEFIDIAVQTDYFWSHSFGNVVCCNFLHLEFRRVGNEIHATANSWYTNFTDWAYFLFQNTSFMDLSWSEWHSPCCSTFFIDSELIRKHPREEYGILLDRLRTIVSLGYCGMFNRRACTENSSQILRHAGARNYHAGQLLERAWGPMFTGSQTYAINGTNPF
jgi:hypothetical protein